MDLFFNYLLEFFFIVAGLMFAYAGYRAYKDETNAKNVGTALFWTILAVLFIFGRWLPAVVSGILVVGLGVITMFKQFGGSTEYVEDTQKAADSAAKHGNKVFIPVIVMAVSAIVISWLIPASSTTVIGIGALLSLIVAIYIFKPSVEETLNESNRMVQQIGTTSILPQLLAALGIVFVEAGVGDIVANLISGFVPQGNIFLGVTAYVLGMMIFTMIMGNAFAAFTVITAGIGVPFVLAQGGDPVIAGALAMTAGYCGTLLTPMAGNFNILPVALLEMKDEYGVIKAQLPMAVIMAVVHILLMYFWAF
ncbi:DUF979 domain-containing protein [Fundicoccus culcitae]|uniref:DUF979 domain-containing protein n=1 Tax=Fundicoccus culcitae TaxID=2969821 RepID=A0ABY5P5N5_9LACT|nr:DUF979 domain-containing protein [Fundicoccus culcitae]UUX33738.1 DUF979 domain-containing protein [Fundicoccus culcitae]